MDLDLQAMQSAILNGLPAHARWMVDTTPLDYDFSATRRGLHSPPIEVADGDPDWLQFLVFGKYDYAEGGGAAPWLCIHKTDGAVFGIDLERRTPVFALNSSLEAFIRTFSVLNNFVGAGKKLPREIEAMLRQIDPDGYPVSDWRLLVDCLTPG